MSTVQELTVALSVLFILMVSLCGGIIISEKIGYDYKIEALEATKDCPECQLVIISKGVGR